MLLRYSELEMAVLAVLASPNIKKQQTDADTLNKTDIDNLHKAIMLLQAPENCHCGSVWGKYTNCFNDPATVTYTLMNAMEEKPNDSSMEKTSNEL